MSACVSQQVTTSPGDTGAWREQTEAGGEAGVGGLDGLCGGVMVSESGAGMGASPEPWRGMVQHGVAGLV